MFLLTMLLRCFYWQRYCYDEISTILPANLNEDFARSSYR